MRRAPLTRGRRVPGAAGLPGAWMLGLSLALAGVAGVAGCRTTASAPKVPVERDASTAFYRAWAQERHATEGTDVEALAKAAEAAAPDWVAPKRFLDEQVHRRGLTLPGRYGEYLSVALDPDASSARRAVNFYLAGRLGGEGADGRLDQATRHDPSLGWAWHGLAWRAFSRGDGAYAVRAGRRAAGYARDPHELTHFAAALAQYEAGEDLNTSAQETLARALSAPVPLALRLDEAASLRAKLTALELESAGLADHRRGVRRGLAALADPGLTLAERANLVYALRGGPVTQNLLSRDELAFAVLAGVASLPEAEGAQLMRAMDPVVLGNIGDVSLTPDAKSRPLTDLAKAFRSSLASGAARDAFVNWLSELPPAVLDEAGQPKRAALAALSDALQSGQGQGYERRVGAALLRAGWFSEANQLAAGVLSRGPGEDAERWARTVQAEAIEGSAVLSSIYALAARIDAREAFIRAGAVGSTPLDSVEGGRVESLRELEAEVVALFERFGQVAPGTVNRKSPVIRYGPLGKIAHPGPAFSAEDAGQGRGVAGEQVPGIADLFGSMGRFALLGQGVGQGGPDATVLRVVGVESKSGEHLGRPFEGTVFWCDGADVPGRFGRKGASISGAALHEGYYVDLAMVRREQAQWSSLRSRFKGHPSRIERALRAPGARVSVNSKGMRTEITPALGANDRMRLAVLSEDQSSPGDLRSVTLAELAAVVAVHEEGHLCDRKGWYPLSFRRIMRLIAFAGAHGFRSGRIAEALEERAQLVALCDAADPRLAWVDLLDAAENSGGGGTPHAAAYRRVLKRLMERLDDEYEDGDWLSDGLNPGERWIDQLHRLPAEKLRGLARREAVSRGLGR